MRGANLRAIFETSLQVVPGTTFVTYCDCSLLDIDQRVKKLTYQIRIVSFLLSGKQIRTGFHFRTDAGITVVGSLAVKVLMELEHGSDYPIPNTKSRIESVLNLIIWNRTLNL